MKRLSALLKQNLMLAGMLVVLVPLLVILALQYRSLAALETALPVWRKEEMRNFLREVARETETYYRREAAQALNIPSSAILNRQDGVVIVNGPRENILRQLEGAAQHFRRQQFKGAKNHFVAVIAQHEERFWNAVVFYDPATGELRLDQVAPEWFPILLAFAPYGFQIRFRNAARPEIIGIDHLPDHRLILKPVIDEAGRIIAVAGVEIDQRYFRETLLVEAFSKAASRRFAQNGDEVLVVARDAGDQLMMSSQPGAVAEAEAAINFEFLFRDWKLGARISGLTEAQKARRLFLLNLSLSALMSLLLIGGLLLALRTAAREVKLSEMKADFVSNVSHELRTPLSSIQVFGELLKQGRVTDGAMVREFGDFIDAESRRLTQLINKILDFARIESGRKSYEFEPAEIGHVVGETLRAEELRLRPEGFAVRLSLPERPLPLVRIDAEAIAQALANLLDNAARYSGAARDIRVRLDRQGDHLTIAVTDHGIGIPRAEHEKIFEKFYRVSTGLVHDVKGSGLGLSIVSHIVRAHGGKVTVASEPGEGSTFTIHLPMSAAGERIRSAG